MPGNNIDVLPPEPEQSGVEPSQTKATEEQSESLVRVSSSQGISQYPITEALREISESSGVRGQAGMVLLLASTQSLESQVFQLRQEKIEALKAADRWREGFHAKKERTSVLHERLGALRRLKDLKQIVATLGALVVGVAGSRLTADLTGGAIAAAVLGVLLLLASWWPVSGPKEDS